MRLSVFNNVEDWNYNSVCISHWQHNEMYIAIAVTTARRIHLFSSRTQKLSFATPKVLVGQLTGRIGSCRIQLRNTLVLMNKGVSFFIVIARERSDRGNPVVKWRSDCIVARTQIFGIASLRSQ